jgi:hypothetical protein
VVTDPGSKKRFMNALSEWIFPSEHRPALLPRSVRWRTLNPPGDGRREASALRRH